MSSTDTLATIEERFDAGVEPAQVIEALLPATRAEAVTWARRLSGWDEYRDRYPGRVVAVARLVSRRAMKEHDLVLTEDGRVIGRSTPRGCWVNPPAPEVFPLLDGQVRVEYTSGDCTDRDHFQFQSPHDPVRPMPLSASGWWSHFANRDAVEACGGPAAYATLYAQAKSEGRADEFEARFDGTRPGAKRRSQRTLADKSARPVAEGHPGATPAGDAADGGDGPPGRLF